MQESLDLNSNRGYPGCIRFSPSLDPIWVLHTIHLDWLIWVRILTYIFPSLPFSSWPDDRLVIWFSENECEDRLVVSPGVRNTSIWYELREQKKSKSECTPWKERMKWILKLYDITKMIMMRRVFVKSLHEFLSQILVDQAGVDHDDDDHLMWSTRFHFRHTNRYQSASCSLYPHHEERKRERGSLWRHSFQSIISFFFFCLILLRFLVQLPQSMSSNIFMWGRMMVMVMIVEGRIWWRWWKDLESCEITFFLHSLLFWSEASGIFTTPNYLMMAFPTFFHIKSCLLQESFSMIIRVENGKKSWKDSQHESTCRFF